MKKVFYLLVLLLCSASLFAQQTEEWIRYASISPDGQSIVFSKKGDLYLVSSKGGEAKALTSHEAHDYMPVWSKDGKKIAFASNRYGNFDVFVINAEGGRAKRLTFHSTGEYPYSFTADNKEVIFGAQRMDAVNHRQYPTGSQPELYKVPVKGGQVAQIWTLPAELVQVNKAGSQMIYQDKKGGENEFRKHHTSAITRDIWKYDVKSGKHTMLTSFNGEDRNPIYSTDEKSVFYLSEQSGTFNVHKFALDNPTKSEQITNFKMHPVRYLSMSKNGTLCYTHNGDLFIQPVSGKQEMLKVNMISDDKENNEKIVSVRGNVREMAISPNGKEVAYIVRGEVFVSSVKGKYTKRITKTSEQESFLSFSPDGKSIIYASERNGRWGIYKTSKKNDSEPYFYASTLLKEEAVICNDNENYEPSYSPDGKEIAFIENKTTLRVYNLKAKKSRTIIGSDKLFYMGDGDQYFAWSPDSKWLLVEYSPVLANSEVLLLSVGKDHKSINLTESGYGDYTPRWVNGGKQILWFSDRNGLRSQAHSGSKQLDVYSMFMTTEVWDKFNMNEDDYALLKEMDKKAKDKKKDDKKDKKKKDKKKSKKKDKKKENVKPLTIDWDGLLERKDRLTIHSAKIADAVLSKDAETLYYLARFEKGYNLWSTKLRTGATKMLIKLNARSGSLQWDKDMKNLFLLSGGNISTVNLKGKSTKSVNINSEMTLDLLAERQNMFDHVWQRNKTMFYISDYHGADWDALKKNYEPKLKSLGDDMDFVELLSEMLGELNVSHSGARYRGYSSKGDRTAALGVFTDYSFKGDGIKIAEIIKGGPLDKKKYKLQAGMIIKSINGNKITHDVDYAKFLNRISGKFTSINIYNPKTKKATDLTMKPISTYRERSLLYKRWVKQNEEEVERVSKGTLAYVHIPGMNDGSYRNTYDKVMGKYYNAKGLIVDTRFNGGGDLVGDITMFLTGVKFMEYAIEKRSIGAEPNYRWTKPSVAMANEANYSDGSCFSCAYTELGIGKLIGMPVPGTCSFAGWEMLQSGTVLWGSIPVSAKNQKGEWLENNQTVPDIIVKNQPGIIDNGRDQQLEAAIKAITEETK